MCNLRAASAKSVYPINCEGRGNAFYFYDLSVAGTIDRGHDHPGIPVAVSHHRNRSYFRNYLAGWLNFDSGPALDGIGLSRRVRLQVGAAIFALGLDGLRHSSHHGAP